MTIISKPTGLDTTGKLLYEILRQLDQLTKVTSKITGGAIAGGSLKLFLISSTDGVLDEQTNIVTGTTTFALPADCDISNALTKPMIVLNPGRVGYTLSGVNGAAFITFVEAPILGDVPEVYYSVI